MSASETIYALSTAQGRAGVAVIRVSGPGARSALEALTATQAVKLTPRRAVRAHLVSPIGYTPLDDGLVLWFPGPHSFTGEDVVEFHVHGGRAVVAGVLGALGTLPGVRQAEAGEFTRRAFENGKIDLTEAEGLADLIDAETESQRSLALKHMGGVLRHAAEAWRSDIITAQALAEAAIDFSDEGDVSAQAIDQARAVVERLSADIGRHLDDKHRGEILRDGFRVAVAGLPNAGKSSLINRLAGRDAVIVSDEAGTTRDVVELHLNLDGVRVLIADTAGIREAEGKIEREGIRRGMAWLRAAHLLLWVSDGGAQPLDKIPDEIAEMKIAIVRVVNKSDLASSHHSFPPPGDEFRISALLGTGVDDLVAEIGRRAYERTAGGETSLISQHRHRVALDAAHTALRQFLSSLDDSPEIGAEHLRSAANELGKLTGRIDVEDVLGAIFGRFCIGK